MHPDPAPGPRTSGAPTGTSTTSSWLAATLAVHRPAHAARLALRTRSTEVREALALAASAGKWSERALLERAVADRLPGEVVTRRNARRLAALALVWAGGARDHEEPDAAARTYQAIWRAGAGDRLAPPHHRVAAQTLFLTGRHRELTGLLPEFTRLPEDARRFLTADLVNPHRTASSDSGPAASTSAARPDGDGTWERLLSAPFTEHGLHPPGLQSAAAAPWARHPFDRLGAPTAAPGTVDGPSVSVVLPCYNPDEGLLTSVASLRAQTYGPLQMLLVDDGSGDASRQWFEAALALDDRVSLIRLPDNGGNYPARNAALGRATGEFVTFQDGDDWSHPERIAAQVALLTGSPDIPASHSLAVRARDDLTHQWLGYPCVRVNASSLMVRSSVLGRLGGFLPVRKGGDSEYAERIVAEVGPVPDTGTPLAVTRLRAGSLSRGDFRYQWASPDRLTYRGAYRAWLRAGRRGRAPVPVTFLAPGAAAATAAGGGSEESPRVADRLEVAFVADFSGDPQSATGGLAHLWSDPPPAPVRTGLWHLERPWGVAATRTEMHDRWFDRVVGHEWWQALSRVEPVHVDRVVVLDPSALLLAGDQACRVTADAVEIHLPPVSGTPAGRPDADVDGEPAEGDVDAERLETEVDTERVEAVVRRWFGVVPRWVSPPGSVRG